MVVHGRFWKTPPIRWVESMAMALLTVSAPVTMASAAATPLKAPGQLVAEVMAFLESDVGIGGIRTMDGDPQGAPVPPYFYHYAIQHDDGLVSSTNGYPGYASISYPGYTASVAMDAFLAWWAFSGDVEALARARALADWLLPRRTPPTDLYGNWVYSTQTDGVMGGGFDGDAIMSDKPAMFALRCLRLADITGDPAYEAAAREIADTYVSTQRSGDPAEDGRWPFRVRPSDGRVRQDYTSHLVPAVHLLEQMAARHPGGGPGQGYAVAAARAWGWLEQNPLNPSSPDSMRFEGFYEDITPTASMGLRDHYSAENTLAALVERGNPGDLEGAIRILDWSTQRYLAPTGIQDGYGQYAPALLEWDAWLNTTYAATGQWAYVNLLLEEATRGTGLHHDAWRDRGVLALYTLSYGQGTGLAPADGRMLTTVRELTQPSFGTETWYEQNFNTVKYILLGMGLAPELAPGDEDHLLRRWGGELQSIAYGPARVEASFAAPGRALFKLTARPRSVQVDGSWRPAEGFDPNGHGWSWDAAAQLCNIVHGGDAVILERGEATGAELPSSSRLLAPYPNPFNPHVAIPWRLARAGRLRLSVIDVRGRELRILVNGLCPGGAGQVVWDGTDAEGEPVSSGCYLVVLRADGFRSSAPVILLR